MEKDKGQAKFYNKNNKATKPNKPNTVYITLKINLLSNLWG